jgi:hypothetical protein
MPMPSARQAVPDGALLDPDLSTIEVLSRDRIHSHQKAPPTNAIKNASDHRFIGIKNVTPSPASHHATLFP